MENVFISQILDFINWTLSIFYFRKRDSENQQPIPLYGRQWQLKKDDYHIFSIKRRIKAADF